MEALLFDFDGVIIHSDPIKDSAFEYIFRDYPDHYTRFLPFHRENGGVSRYDKIRYFHGDLLGSPIDETEVNRIASEFSAYIFDQLCKPECLIQDACSQLALLSELHPLHIVSASDEKELKSICDAQGLSTHFRSIHGSPGTKSEIVKRVFDSFGYLPSRTLLVGDSKNDYLAAREHGIPFYGYNNEALRGLEGGLYLESFEELTAIVSSSD